MSKAKTVNERKDDFMLRFKNENFKIFSEVKLIGEYKNMRTKVLFSTKYGNIMIAPDSIIRGGYDIRSAVDKTSYWIEMVKANRDDWRDYDFKEVNYIKNSSKVNIICNKHGIFSMEPANFLSGQCCPKCQNNKPTTYEDFVEESKSIFGEGYLYYNEGYKNSKSKVKMYCLKHQVFFYKDRYHHIYRKQGCPICGMENGVEKRKKSIGMNNEKFISLANSIFDNKYSYEKLRYTNPSTKVTIICPIHGEFSTLPYNHIHGAKGCPKCGKERMEDFTLSTWTNGAKNDPKFSSFKLYVIKCFNENEFFYKIGRTRRSVEDRYRSKKDMPYEWEIVDIIESNNGEYIWNLEKKIQNTHNDFLYTPKIKFGGITECFSQFIGLDDLKV